MATVVREKARNTRVWGRERLLREEGSERKQSKQKRKEENERKMKE